MTHKMMGKKQRWSQGLPNDILQSIAQRLYTSDYLVFRQVCSSWRAAVDRGIATRSCPPAPQLPWLLLLDSYGFSLGDRDSLDAFYIEHQYSLLRSPTSFRSETSSAPHLRYCVGSVESWLIVTIRQQCRSNNFLFNPLSRARVMLPSDTFTLFKTVASSPPSVPATNCFVAAHCCLNRIGICRPIDTSWTLIETRCQYTDLEIIDQKLYIVGLRDDEYTLLEIDMLSGEDNVTSSKYNCSIRIYISYFAESHARQYACLVRDSTSKELFVVLYTSRRELGVLVYKMKRNSSDEKMESSCCEKVTDLGDRILFLSSRSNKVINDRTLGKNCIYFAFKLTQGCWVYSLKDKSFKRVNLPKDYSSRSCGSTLWFTPHPW